MITLQANNLAKRYQSRQVVTDVSLSINQGEIVGLLGPNGAGKTTSFYMMVGLVQCDHGQVFIGEHEITHLPIHTRSRLGLGYLPQEASIFRRMTVQDNVMAILELNNTLSKSARQDKLENLLDEFHLQAVRGSLGMSLSGGERRRVEIARALANDPKFILLDEPFAGVDPISVLEIKRIIKQLANRQIGILITDHNVRETLDISERAYIVNEGRILATGTSQQILDNQQVRKVYLGHEFALAETEE